MCAHGITARISVQVFFFRFLKNEHVAEAAFAICSFATFSISYSEREIRELCLHVCNHERFYNYAPISMGTMRQTTLSTKIFCSALGAFAVPTETQNRLTNRLKVAERASASASASHTVSFTVDQQSNR